MMTLNIRKNLLILSCCCLVLFDACTDKVTPLDWPQFKKDNYRSGYIDAEFDLSEFGQWWVYDTGQEPIPAWYGPAKEDAYARSGALPSMRDYDLSYSPVIVDNSLYYASSADDAVHCHNATNGKEKWHFTTGGPIRIAPTYYDGKIYVGSDDGYVYCLNAGNGALKWKFSPKPEDKQRLLNNGRFISFYPIRTGVLIEDGKAYFGASLLPWKKSYFCAIDAQSGEVGDEGTYVKEYDTNSMTLEGAMASTGKLLIQPQGRIAPMFFNKANGETAGSVAGSGGCFVLITPDSSVVHAKSTRYVSMEETKLAKKQAQFMSYNDGKEIVVKGDSSYVLNDNSLVSYNRKTQKMNWLRQDFQAHRIIIAGNVLFAGEDDKIVGVSLKNGQTIWESKVRGTVYSLSFARNRLYASTSDGFLYAFGEDGDNAEYFAENEAKEPVIEKKKKQENENHPQDLMLSIAAGPYIQPCSCDSVDLTFTTYAPMKVSVDWKSGSDTELFSSTEAQTSHSFRLPVRKGRSYYYLLKNNEGKTAYYYYDNFFNFYTRATYDYPEVDEEALKEVQTYLSKHKVMTGLCLVVGEDSKETALALAKETPMQILDIETSDRIYERFVEDLQKRKSYSRKLKALKVDDENQLPVISEIADLVWVNEGEKMDPDEVIRLIAPEQYAVVTDLKDEKAWLAKSTLDWQVTVVGKEDNLFIIKKNPFENIGVWTHQHGDMRNASYGGESLYGSSQTTDFETQWMGRPGPRFITDRSGRKPAPLAIDGRMFMQGKERIIAINVYNGSLFWMKDMPGLMRMNMAHDCSNWACDESYLYMAINSNLLKVDQLTGEIVKKMNMKLPNDTSYHWGYIGVTPTHLIGSTTVKEAQFTLYHGGGNEGWYDSQSGPNAYKVLSNRLFSVDKKTNELAWEYLPEGAIINPTISAYGNKLLFVESYSANEESKASGRGGDDLYKDTRLVALDLQSGKKVYEQRFKTIEGKTVYFMAANTGKCVVVASYAGEYDIHAFDTETGKEVWDKKHNWFHSNHGAHMSKPAIAGDRLVVKPFVYNVHTGEEASYNTPKAGHGCAHYALSDNAMFYRGASCTMYDFNTRLFSKWERLRPDCWLSTIPALGMVLSPEASGGCSCGMWYETSMVFAPISRTPVLIKAHTDDAAKDYKNETWGGFSSYCNTNKFKKDLLIELELKPGLDVPMYYTTDGTEPTKSSTRYTEPFTLTKNSEVKVAVYIEKAGKERRFTRSKCFELIENKK